MASAGRHTHVGLLAEVRCPNCWRRFPPEQLLFIARHDGLIGDDVAGPHAYRRFRPSRFTVTGDALDAFGLPCQQLACPNCHLEVPRPLIEMLPYFVSIVGAAASGKSYLLAAMSWELRQRASRHGFVIADGDPTANHMLHRYEELLFMSPTPDRPVALQKTQLDGSELYQTITSDGQSQSYPRPFQFTLSPIPGRRDAGSFPYRSVVLYDNAGEHFLPGRDTTASPVTMHLAESSVTLFLFDPTQDARFRAACHSPDPQLRQDGSGASLTRQEVVFNEMAARVRRYRGLSQADRHDKPLVFLVAKADTWMPPDQLDREPFLGDSPVMLDLDHVARTSVQVRELLARYCPEVVAAADAFCREVVYIPVSSLGGSPEVVKQGEAAFLGIRPRNIRPKWVTVPLLWALARNVPNLIPTSHQGGEPAWQAN